jgi:hypothetical protein
MTTAQPSLFIKSEKLYGDSWGSAKTLHIITVVHVDESLSSVKAAINMVKSQIEDITTPHYWSEYDCTGRYSTSRFELIYKSYSSYDMGHLQYIYIEHGSYDV